ncbi:unnamed protein product [Fusarium equiseti]|uniref:Apple domain-containing protein n=1 Tax=Fusarium equiseti TaxID=61235 RepID=A0A8J2IKP8_FUSEQ|nr:unnamed protein product [Fusarium equiseti]
MQYISVWGLVAISALARAGPCKPPKADVCSLISETLGDDAISACSQYLDIQAATVTKTVTTTRTNFVTVVQAQPTESATIELTTTDFITSEETQYSADPTQTLIETVVVPSHTIYIEQGIKKRGSTNPFLSELEGKYRKYEISAACRCVYDSPSETITQTSEATQDATSIVTEGPVTTILVTKTEYVAVTKQVDVTVMMAPTNTRTALVTTTVKSGAITIGFSCDQRGRLGPDADAYNYYSNYDTNQAWCISACKADAACFSTAFYTVHDFLTGVTTGTCRFYNKPVMDIAVLGSGTLTFNINDPSTKRLERKIPAIIKTTTFPSLNDPSDKRMAPSNEAPFLLNTDDALDFGLNEDMADRLNHLDKYSSPHYATLVTRLKSL